MSKCEFSHRKSIFHAGHYVILGAIIHLKKLSFDEAKKVKDARLQFCKEKFEYGKGCFGTCFSNVNYRILNLVSRADKILRFGNGRITFGKRNKNWLVNNGDGKYDDAFKIIRMCKFLHRLFLRKIECEVVIWE